MGRKVLFEGEVHFSIFQSNKAKALGLMSFTIVVYQECWLECDQRGSNEDMSKVP